MIHVMSGIPGSGKTTLSQQLALECDAVLHCYDKMSRTQQPYKTHLLMFNRIIRDLKNGKNVVCDDLHTTEKSRMDLLKALSGVECKKVLHVMNVPPEVCLERVKARDKWWSSPYVVTKQYKHYEEPTLDEGWDEIIYHEYVRE